MRRFPPVMVDGWATRRIIDNLIANGIKFTEPGGSVGISTRRVSDGVGVTIKDTGTGMPPRSAGADRRTILPGGYRDRTAL